MDVRIPISFLAMTLALSGFAVPAAATNPPYDLGQTSCVAVVGQPCTFVCRSSFAYYDGVVATITGVGVAPHGIVGCDYGGGYAWAGCINGPLFYGTCHGSYGTWYEDHDGVGYCEFGDQDVFEPFKVGFVKCST